MILVMIMYKFFIGLLAITLVGCSYSSTDQNSINESTQNGQSKQAVSVMSKNIKQDLEKRDASGATPLMRATRANDIPKAKALIEAGANVNAKDNIQDSPYLYAGARGHLEILNMTLAHGADLKSTNRYGGTALIPAAERGHLDTVKRLIQAGTEVDHVNNLGWTALLEAVILGNGTEKYQQIVQILIESGADVNFKDPKGVSTLQHARQRGYHEIERQLIKAGAK